MVVVVIDYDDYKPEEVVEEQVTVEQVTVEQEPRVKKTQKEGHKQ